LTGCSTGGGAAAGGAAGELDEGGLLKAAPSAPATDAAGELVAGVGSGDTLAGAIDAAGETDGATVMALAAGSVPI
jgi:hypothetical protein